ncbi:MAG: tRNA1(Val) (adenine(37)-N6)-methyltransferase [Eubacteriales bacterium]
MQRVDNIGFGNLRLLQNPKAFCYGVDAVLLADFAARNAEFTRVADLGAGTGIIPLILSHKTNCESIYGIELQFSAFELFEQNIALNSLQNRLKAINTDVADLLELYPDLKGSFDAVTANPPYFKRGAAILNATEEKMLARHESTAGVFEFVKTATDLLTEKGAFFMIHRPGRLSDIFEALFKCNMRAEILQFVATDEDASPGMVLLKCAKSNKELTVLKTLYIYDKNRKYTQDIEKIYER